MSNVVVQEDVVSVIIQQEGGSPVSVQEVSQSSSVTTVATPSTSVTEQSSRVDVFEGIPLSGGGDKNYTQSFTAQTSVIVTHNLAKKPSVTIFDSAGDEVTGDVEYINNNQLSVTFSSAFTGTIILN